MLFGVGLFEIFIPVILGGLIFVAFIAIKIVNIKTEEEKVKILENMSLKKVYLYLMSFVGFIMVIIGGVSILNIIYKLIIYTAFPETTQQPGIMPGDMSPYIQELTYTLPESLAQLTIGIPVWLFHWKKVQKAEKEDVEKEKEVIKT
ncbi:MAG TPA: hypothetical protein ENN38_02395 [Actinobacteria bacterium]|nr:hypothetical protein [Actinomycetota bacterium]